MNQYVSHTSMSLFLIVPWLEMGGADKFNLNLVQQLSTRGWKISILTTLSSANIWKSEFLPHAEVFSLDGVPYESVPLYIQKLIVKKQPDTVLISNSELGYLLLPMLRLACPEPSYIDYCHSEELHWRDGGFPSLSVTYRGYLDATLVASRHLKEWMVGRGGEPERIHVCYVNIDADLWRPNQERRKATREDLGISDCDVVILYPARLSPEKSPQLVVETVRELAKSDFSFKCIIAGDGEYAHKIKQYVQKHGLEKIVYFLGSVPLERMPAITAASDILFLPSRYEGISFALFEAMSVGLTAVVSDVGGQRELVGDDAGVLVTPCNGRRARNNYAKVLLQLMVDPESRKRIGKAARKKIEREFTLERMINLFVELCRVAAAQKRQVNKTDNVTSVVKEAVEYVRAFGKDQAALSEVDLPMKIKLYAAITRIFGPIYFWFLDQKLTWIITIKNYIRKWMRVDD